MTVEAISGVVAAVAAVGAVYFARDTVQKTIAGQKDADKHHAAQITEMKAATKAAADQHRVEMVDRLRLADAEALDRRLTQLERISDLLREIVDTAEHLAAANLQANGSPSIAVLCRRLDNAVNTLQAYGMPYPNKTGTLASEGYGMNTSAHAVSRTATEALSEVGEIILQLYVDHAEQARLSEILLPSNQSGGQPPS